MASFESMPPACGMNPSAVQQRAAVVLNEPMARGTFRMRLRCPELATTIRPGQFFMVRLPGTSDPLLGRPFALFDTHLGDDGHPKYVDFGYVVVGKLTGQLQSLAVGEEVDVWGPLGNGFPLPGTGHLMLVAGGIGQTPFLAAAKEALGLQSYGSPARVLPERPRRVSLCYGVRNVAFQAGVEDFRLPGLEVSLSTDDGSTGFHGYVTDLLARSIAGNDPPDTVFCCGPEPMMRRVAEICAAADIKCWLSLESPMACGFGACFSCVVPVRDECGDGWDYRRSCVDGPVFPADRLILT